LADNYCQGQQFYFLKLEADADVFQTAEMMSTDQFSKEN